jgi:hypothetical protein
VKEQVQVGSITAPPMSASRAPAPGKGLSPEGSSLDPSIRGSAERSLGEDLGGVKVRALDPREYPDARAVTRNGDIYVEPDATDDRELFAHELAHVVQQRRSGAPNATSMLEDEADHHASDIARGTPVTVRGVAAPATPLFVRKKQGEGTDEVIGTYEIWVSDEGPETSDAQRVWIELGTDDETRMTIYAVVKKPARAAKEWSDDVKSLIEAKEKLATQASIGGKLKQSRQLKTLVDRKHEKLAESMKEPVSPEPRPEATAPKKKKRKPKNKTKVTSAEDPEWTDDRPFETATGEWIGADYPVVEEEPQLEEGVLEREVDDKNSVSVGKLEDGWTEQGASKHTFHRKTPATLRAPIVDLSGKRTQLDGRTHVDLKGTSFQSMTGGKYGLIFVTLPADYHKLSREQQVKIFQTVVYFDGRAFLLDQVDSDREGLAAGVEKGCTLFGGFSPFVEATAYTRTALLNSAELGGSGRLHGTALPDGTTFMLPPQTEGEAPVPLQVRDGWGFLRESVAHKMGVDTHTPKQGSLERNASANTQMLMWLDEHRDASVELVDHAMSNLDRGLQGKTDDELYRIATTGNFPLRVGTTMPSPTDQVILPSSLGPMQEPVAIHRNPADKPNWTTARSAPATDPTAKFLDSMWGLQYRWSGTTVDSNHDKVVFKGMVGILPDARWPSEWGDSEVLVARSDRKVDSAWSSQEDADVAKGKKPRPEHEERELTGGFLLDGDFNVNRVYAPKSFVAVPAEQMKDINGDYDGDTVHVLARRESPALYDRVAHDQREMSNDKLPKNLHFDAPPSLDQNPYAALEDDDGSGEKKRPTHPQISPADRMVDAHGQRALVGVWSTVADLLLTAHPDHRPKLAADLGYKTEPELWDVILYGIKAGTDLPKTTLSDSRFGTNHQEAVAWLVTEGRRISKHLRKQLKNPHAKRQTKAIATAVRGGTRVTGNARRNQYGIIAKIMRAMNERLTKGTGPVSGEERDRPTRNNSIGNRALQEAHDVIDNAAKRRPASPSELLTAIYDLIGAYSARLADHRAAARWEVMALTLLSPRDVYQDWLARVRLGVDPAGIAEEWAHQVAAVADAYQNFQLSISVATPPPNNAPPPERQDVVHPDENLVALVEAVFGRSAATSPSVMQQLVEDLLDEEDLLSDEEEPPDDEEDDPKAEEDD